MAKLLQGGVIEMHRPEPVPIAVASDIAAIIPEITDGSLFGEIKSKSPKNRPHNPDECAVCGTKRRLRTVGGVLMSNISDVIGACGNCLMEGRA